MRRFSACLLLVFALAACQPQAPAPASPTASPPAPAATAGAATPTPARPTAAATTPPAAPTATPAAPASPVPTEGPISGTVGETLTTSGWTFTLEKVEWPGKVLEWSNPAGKYEAKGTVLLAVLQARPRSDRGGSLTPRSFSVNAASGDGGDPVSCCVPYLTARSERALLPISEFPAGTPGRITVIFDINPNDRDLTLVFTEDKGHHWKLPNPPAAR